MTMYTVRIELLSYASEAVYEELHRRLALAGVLRFIESKDRVWFHLPPGEYLFHSQLTPHDAFLKIRSLIEQVWLDFRLLVQEVGAQWFCGLAPVENRTANLLLKMGV